MNFTIFTTYSVISWRILEAICLIITKTLIFNVDLDHPDDNSLS